MRHVTIQGGVAGNAGLALAALALAVACVVLVVRRRERPSDAS